MYIWCMCIMWHTKVYCHEREFSCLHHFTSASDSCKTKSGSYKYNLKFTIHIYEWGGRIDYVDYKKSTFAADFPYKKIRFFLMNALASGIWNLPFLYVLTTSMDQSRFLIGFDVWSFVGISISKKHRIEVSCLWVVLVLSEEFTSKW